MIPILDLPHSEARALLAGGAPVYLPINPVEYHGPHLPLHTDALISDGLIRALHSRLAARHPDWPLLACANLPIGVDPVPGPGTRAVPFPVARALILQAVEALADLGAKRVVLMTFHGSPLHNLALEAGVRLLERRGVQAFSPLNLILREMLSLDPRPYAPAYAHVTDVAEREAMIADLAGDFHGGFFETSMLLHYRPEAVSPSYVDVPPCPPVAPRRLVSSISRLARSLGADALSTELGFAALGLAWYGLRPFPGYTGRPHHATGASGAIFAGQIIDRYAEHAEALFAGKASSPRPIMSWVATASLGGRAGNLDVPLDAIGTART